MKKTWRCSLALLRRAASSASSMFFSSRNTSLRLSWAHLTVLERSIPMLILRDMPRLVVAKRIRLVGTGSSPLSSLWRFDVERSFACSNISTDSNLAASVAILGVLPKEWSSPKLPLLLLLPLLLRRGAACGCPSDPLDSSLYESSKGDITFRGVSGGVLCIPVMAAVMVGCTV